MQVLAKGLAKRPEDRFASAADMAAALRAALETPADSDSTIVQLRPKTPAEVPPVFDPATLSDIVRQLATYCGPIAGTLVQSAARRAPSVQALRDMLAGAIEHAADRERFLRAGSAAVPMSLPASAAQSPSSATLTPELAAVAQRELARFVGPIAAVLVKRALPAAGSAAELWNALGSHIDAPQDRARFLRTTP
jgi:serine/threonine-protein kinase